MIGLFVCLRGLDEGRCNRRMTLSIEEINIHSSSLDCSSDVLSVRPRHADVSVVKAPLLLDPSGRCPSTEKLGGETSSVTVVSNKVASIRAANTPKATVPAGPPNGCAVSGQALA